MYAIPVQRLLCVPRWKPSRQPGSGVMNRLPRCTALRCVSQRAPPFQITSAGGHRCIRRFGVHSHSFKEIDNV